MDTLKTLTYAAANRIARITLNRPERGKNGITPDMPREIALRRRGARTSIRACT